MDDDELDNIGIEIDDIDDIQWEILYEQIVKGNVIPVIGSDLIKIGDKTSLQTLIDAVSKACGIGKKMETFSQLLFHESYKNSNLNKKSDIYHILKNTIDKHSASFDNEKSNTLLKTILEIPYFKFVITTSFDPIVENMMRRIHGSKLKVLNFCNNPTNNDDLLNGEETNSPTLYYMFGKANYREHSFVVTDEDLLHFSQSWLRPNDYGNSAKPSVISALLANRYLLVLGHDFKDWLFRFFWYALKSDAFGNKEGGMLALKQEDADLIGFLNRANTFAQVQPDMEILVNKIIDGIKKYEDEHRITPGEGGNANVPPQEGTDVFISYSRGDSEKVKKIYDGLTKKGLNVWFDRDSLRKGLDFMKQIENAVKNSTFFVPVFTPTIEKQADEEHPYRKEWLFAIDHIQNTGGVSYCFPFFEEGFNMDDIRCAIPNDLKRHDAFSFKEDTLEKDIDSLADYLLKEKMNRQNAKH